jgi:hypothetical protein
MVGSDKRRQRHPITLRIQMDYTNRTKLKGIGITATNKVAKMSSYVKFALPPKNQNPLQLKRLQGAL